MFRLEYPTETKISKAARAGSVSCGVSAGKHFLYQKVLRWLKQTIVSGIGYALASSSIPQCVSARSHY